jgi:hypothetical protein
MSFSLEKEAFIDLNNNLLQPGAYRGQWIGAKHSKLRARAPAWRVLLLHALGELDWGGSWRNWRLQGKKQINNLPTPHPPKNRDLDAVAL